MTGSVGLSNFASISFLIVIELLVDKSDQLDASALQFKKRSTRLKRSDALIVIVLCDFPLTGLYGGRMPNCLYWEVSEYWSVAKPVSNITYR